MLYAAGHAYAHDPGAVRNGMPPAQAACHPTSTRAVGVGWGAAIHGCIYTVGR
jgi:hypothetical protein